MDMVIEISVAVIAIAFVVLVIYLICVIKALILLSNQLNHITIDLKGKLNSTNPLFNSLMNVGEVLENKTSDFKKKALVEEEHPEFVCSEEHKIYLNKCADVLALAGIGIRLWQKFKKGDQ